MNWEAIGAIAELTGALAVFLTLVYLAVQIRQNTKALQGTTLNAITAQTGEELKWASEQTDVRLKARDEFESLSEAELWPLYCWLASALQARENEYFQFKLGLLDRMVWDSRLNIVENIFDNEWAIWRWKDRLRNVYSDEFTQLIDGVVAAKRKVA